MASVVDRFYSLLGEKGWVFSEVLSVERIRLIVEKSADSSSAEDDFISYLKEGEVINFALSSEIEEQSGCDNFPSSEGLLKITLRADITVPFWF